MENFVKLGLSICFSWMLLSSSSVSMALDDCHFPAIFNFGDSNSDTGGLAAAFPHAVSPPYGETFFHDTVGRYSDGRVILDFIANSFDLPFLGAYLDSLGNNFKHGANFATSASTIRLPKIVLPDNGGYSPFFLDFQTGHFQILKATSETQKHGVGTVNSDSIPDMNSYSKALYTFDIGQNDLSQGLWGLNGNLTIDEVKNTTIPDMIDGFVYNFKNIYYSSGGKAFWIHNTGPIGCLPYCLIRFPSAEKDKAGCAKDYNEVAQYYNSKLKEAVVQLRNDLPLAAITYVDVYSAKYALFAEPEKYGLEKPLIACCGYGGDYNYNMDRGCGGMIDVNGSQILVGSCQKPWLRVNWDGIHYTEAANKVVFDKISSGAYSDPPIPLKHACHRV